MATYKSSYTGPQIDAAVGHAVNMDVNPTAGHTDRVVSSGGVKSALDNVFQTDATYPACLFRMNGNDKEWLNPPMILDTEYRTVERYLSNLIVYTKYIRVPFSGSGSISSPAFVLLYTEPSATNILEVTGTVYRYGYGLYSANMPTRHGLYAFTNKAYIAVLAEYGPSSYANIIIKYYKS